MTTYSRAHGTASLLVYFHRPKLSGVETERRKLSKLLVTKMPPVVYSSSDETAYYLDKSTAQR